MAVSDQDPLDEDDFYVLVEERLDVREFDTVAGIIGQTDVNLDNLPPLTASPVEYVPIR